MFYFLEDFDVANYAEFEFVVNNLEHSLPILFKWLNDNYMKLNSGKSHLLV